MITVQTRKSDLKGLQRVAITNNCFCEYCKELRKYHRLEEYKDFYIEKSMCMACAKVGYIKFKYTFGGNQ